MDFFFKCMHDFFVKEDEVSGFTNSLKGFVHKRKQENADFGITITEIIKLARGY